VSATATAASGSQASEAGRVYVWELPVRLSHWGIALSIVVLAATGIYIGRPFGAVPGEASAAFLMGRMKQIHTGAAIVFTLSVLARIVWMFVGNRYARFTIRWRASPTASSSPCAWSRSEPASRSTP
jgi:Ni/Fe-hydrogenase 1 B-type cytochrome subunit